MRIALCGYKGKVGKEVYNLLKENKYKVIGIDVDTKPLYFYIEDVDLVIDFTNKNSSLKNIFTCLDYHKPFIVGSTTFKSDELSLIKELCNKEQVKGVICYNFSLPINLLLKQIPFFSAYFTNYEYFDIHDISKIDKVSGTTYLFLLKNKKFTIKTIRKKSNNITYVIKMTSKYDKIIITYMVNDRKVYALGLLNYLKTNDDSLIINLLK